MGPLGLIAGKGSLPRIVCETAHARGVAVAAAAFDRKSADALSSLATVRAFGVGQVEGVINFLKKSGCSEVVLIGKFEKSLAFDFSALNPDSRAKKIWASLKDKKDSSVMLAIINELESAGLKVARQTDWIPQLMPPAGILGKVRPSANALDEVKKAMALCKGLAGQDIGQTIIVKDGVVLAVEAVEGTNEAIKRGCKLGGKGAVMVKASRPKQDLRFDIPAVGLPTVQLLAEHNAAGLAVEAGGVVVVDIADVAAECDRRGMFLAAV